MAPRAKDVLFHALELLKEQVKKEQADDAV